VDAYGPEEQALGWWVYLDEHLSFPFRARCVVERRSSPLALGEKVTVEGMAPEEDCSHEMFVMVRWKRRSLAVPLSQLEGLDIDDDTHEAIQDWLYWIDQGYQF
jgi:hypothetical protein